MPLSTCHVSFPKLFLLSFLFKIMFSSSKRFQRYITGENQKSFSPSKVVFKLKFVHAEMTTSLHDENIYTLKLKI